MKTFPRRKERALRAWRRSGAAIALLLCCAQRVCAHVKWFVPDEEAVVRAMHKGPVYGLFEAPVLVWIGLSLAILAAGSFLDKFLPEPAKLAAFARSNEKKALLLFQALIGLFLVYIGLTRNIVLVPEIAAVTAATKLLKGVEIVAGFLLFTNYAPRAGALLILALYLGATALAGRVFMLENVLLIGIAGFIFVRNCPDGPGLERCRPHSVPFLRVCAGISLSVLAFTDKLLFPELAYSFLSVHHWNFMPLLGFPGFTDQLFILCAGVTELLFGLVFILGYVTRVNAAVMTSFFAMSVIAMGVGSGRWEVEDLPIYAVALIMVLYGAGNREAAAPAVNVLVNDGRRSA